MLVLQIFLQGKNQLPLFRRFVLAFNARRWAKVEGQRNMGHCSCVKWKRSDFADKEEG